MGAAAGVSGGASSEILGAVGLGLVADLDAALGAAGVGFLLM